MPQIKECVLSLKEICVIRVAIYLDDLCRPYYEQWNKLKDRDRPHDGPLRNITDDLLMLIFNKMQQMELLRTRHLRIFILNDTFKFTFTNSIGLSVNTAITLLSARCRNLRELVLRTHHMSPLNYGPICGNISRDIMCSALVELNRLRKLHLDRYNVDDNVVVVIATHLTRLRSLSLRATEVTDVGLYALKRGDYINIVNHGFVARSVVDFTLKYLDIRQTMATPNCVIELSKLMYLKTFLSDNFLEACCQIWRDMVPQNISINSVPFFPYKTLSQIFNPQSAVPSKRTLVAAIKMVGLADAVILDKIPNAIFKDLQLIFRLRLTTLELSCAENWRENSFDEIRILFGTNGFFLETLRLESFAKVSLHFVGLRCPRISKLILLNNTFTSTRIQRSHFKQLTYLNITSWLISGISKMPLNENNCVPPRNLLFLLSRPELTKCILVQQVQLTDSVFSDLLTKTTLPSLQSLFLASCNQLTIVSLMSLVALANPLKYLDIMGCLRLFENDFLQLSEYVKNHNLNLEIRRLEQMLRNRTCFDIFMEIWYQ